MRFNERCRLGLAVAARCVDHHRKADCFAGIWAHSTEQRDILERGDVEEGIGAAAAVGDDRIQKQGGARVNPETWTHGSSQQRVQWFQRGMQKGSVADCNTFAEAG